MDMYQRALYLAEKGIQTIPLDHNKKSVVTFKNIQITPSFIRTNEELYRSTTVLAHVEVGTSNFISLPRWYIKGNQGTAIIEDWEMNGRIVKATGNDVENKPSPIRAGVGLTKTMAPPVDGVTETLPLPESKPADVSFYRNFYDVVTVGAEPIVKNEEVRQVMKLIDSILK